MKVYLVRHGETEWNSIRKLQGQTDILLNDYGKELAEITAKALENIQFDYVYSSPLTRAIQTAKIIIGDRNLVINTDDRIKEINFGQCEGVQIPRYSEYKINPIWDFEFDTENYIPAEGGETFNDIYERTGEFFQNVILPLEGKYENVLIIGHGCMNRTILNRVLNRPLRDFWEIKLDNCAVSIIEIKNGKAEVVETGKKYYERVNDPGDISEEVSIYG